MRGRGRASVLVGVAILLLAGSAVVASASATRRAQSGSEPKVLTGGAERSGNGFVLKGTVNPGGLRTSYRFIYKPVGSAECEDLVGCGPTTRSKRLSASSKTEVQDKVTHLEADTEYEYWLLAHNSEGTAVGGRRHFTVAAPR